MSNATKHRQGNVTRQSGERARLKVAQGPDYGSVYVITGVKATIGRGEESDVVLTDLKASRRHAEVVLTASGWMVGDLGSANGIILNGKPVKSVAIKSYDRLSIGETVLEFVQSDLGTNVLVAPPARPAQLPGRPMSLNPPALPAEAGGGQLAAAKNGFFGALSSIKGMRSLPSLGGSAKAPTKNPALILGLVAVAVLFLLLPDDSKKKAPARSGSSGTSRTLAAYLPVRGESGAPNRTADAFFKEGFREYREHNFLRAKTQFETVLQIVPGHPMARLYLENCNQSITEEVKYHLEQGKKDEEAGKLKEARGHFEAITRLLWRDTTNPAYAEAKDWIEKLLKEDSSG